MRDTAVRLRLPHKKILLSRHGSSRRNTNPAFSPHQPVGQNVRGYPLLRPGQQLAEVTAVAEHQVADDDQAPTLPQRLDSQVDLAARAWGRSCALQKPIAI